MHLSLDFKIIFSPVRQSLSNIIEDFALLRSNFFLLNNFVIFSSLKIVFFEKPASEFSFRFNIDGSDLPLELKTTTSHVCLPSSLIISNLSSGNTSKTDKPPPLTKYLSTPGGKILKPGFLISRLVKILSIYSKHTISMPNIHAMDIDLKNSRP